MSPIKQTAKTKYPQTQLMRQGVGVITSMAFTLTIDDAYRFRKSRDIAAYLGLLPRQTSAQP